MTDEPAAPDERDARVSRDALDEPAEHARLDKRDAELIRMIRQHKAEAAIRAVNAGANPALEAFLLANEFTDSVTGSLRGRIRRLLGRA